MAFVSTADDRHPALPQRTLNCGNYGIFLIMGNAGLVSSTVRSIKGMSAYPEGPYILPLWS